MATNNLRPLGVGYSDQYTLVAGATKVAAVDASDPLSHDDGTTYIRHTATGQVQSFTCTNKPPAYGILNPTVTSGSRSATLSGNVGGSFGLRLNGTNAAVAASHGNEFTWTTHTGASARPGGGTWVMDDIQSSTFEMWTSSAGSATDYMGVTSMWVVTDWVAPPGGFAFLFGLSSLVLLNQDQFAAWLRAQLPGTIFNAADYAFGWAEHLANTYPKYFV